MSQTGIFNVLDYGLGPSPSTPPSTNREKLQDLVTNLLSADGHTNGNGGTIEFPMIQVGTSPGTYQFDDTITIGSTDAVPPGKGPATIIFKGTCPWSFTEGTELPIPTLQMTVAKDLFVVDNHKNPDDNVGGIVFEDLSISYGASLTTGAAVRVQNQSQNVRFLRTIFENCPVAVAFDNSLQCSMLECLILVAGNSSAAVTLGTGSTSAIETYIAGCLFRPLAGSTEKITGIAIYNNEHARVMNLRLEGFKVGLSFQPTGQSFRNHFENVSVREISDSATVGAALLIQPQGGTGSVTETVFVNCEFGPTDAGGTIYTLGGIYVDATSGTVDVLRFVSCTSINWPGPGLQIRGGAAGQCAHIEVVGGEYSSNGQAPPPTVTNKYGIMIGTGGAVAGSIANVRVSGASCVGSVLGFTTHQEYGIYITDGAKDVIVDHCDLTGNTGAAAFVGSGTGSAPTNVFIRNCNATGYGAGNPPPSFQFSSPGTVEVTECPGYNDQATVLKNQVAAPASVTNVSLGYYGVVAFYVKGAGNVTIDRVDTTLTDGGYTLSPGESAAIANASQATKFLAVGK